MITAGVPVAVALEISRLGAHTNSMKPPRLKSRLDTLVFGIYLLAFVLGLVALGRYFFPDRSSNLPPNVQEVLNKAKQGGGQYQYQVTGSLPPESNSQL